MDDWLKWFIGIALGLFVGFVLGAMWMLYLLSAPDGDDIACTHNHTCWECVRQRADSLHKHGRRAVLGTDNIVRDTGPMKQ
jgi:hypothetical protein